MPIAQELPIDLRASALEMANTIFGSGITVNSASYSGGWRSSGIYTNGDTVSPGVTPGDTGVILSTGNASDFTNNSGTTNTNEVADRSTNTSGSNGDPDFEAIASGPTYDASYLEVDFTPTGDTLTLSFVIGSEEYPEFINSAFLDVVGIWVNGTQASVSVGDGQVSVGNINGNQTPNLYQDNTGDQFNTEMDGFTITLKVTAPVNVGVSNTIKIGVADVSDTDYDTNLLIAGGSAQTALIAGDDSVNVGLNSSKTFDVLGNDTSSGGTLTITHVNGIAVTAGSSITLTSGATVILNADGTFTVLSDADAETVYFTYTVDDGLGASDIGIVQVNQMPCFVAGTLMDTPHGPVRVEDLRPGDLVLTLDNGPQPVCWAGSREIEAKGNFAPIRICAGSYGAEADVLLSPQHRVLIRDVWAELLFGDSEVLVKAKDLVNHKTVRREESDTKVTYVHLLLDQHNILFSQGLLSESYLPGPMMKHTFPDDACAEIITLFPELADIDAARWAAARPILKTFEAQALQARAA
ncbi:choice-of-anchor L domain-containing protein [Marivita sp. XM-24bin2]|uniref:choice-of-anchor L domain-containing protein n=1 Tax=unclassified Marivita TaxID=2632480 RepID=UPI000D7A6C76|nr:choice-of-anchor L domain-containing protein [Marivita sp. XM-24bin2]MCR9110105.1 choice-of-anchor L domain-containing protein [Paracoccaceae bacterium]PWL34275.1 MAG: 2,3,4,5-tetrahydropyridine-2,6-carboxylate N-succinyltransferase [Marivita sp. XM-24bin2]